MKTASLIFGLRRQFIFQSLLNISKLKKKVNPGIELTTPSLSKRKSQLCKPHKIIPLKQTLKYTTNP